MSRIASEIRQVVRAVSRHVPLETIQFPDEFFPAHLSVALIDAVYGARPDGGGYLRPVSERYCRHFGLVRRRANRWEPPPVRDQEPLRDLIGHFDELGTDGMAAEVFLTSGGDTGTHVARAECVLRLATMLRTIGVDVLQDMGSWRRVESQAALRTLAGADEHIVRVLMNYAGEDDFVWGDVSVRRFVGLAVGRETISALRAASLVRQAAHELILSPRYLDYQIRAYCDALSE